MKESKIKQRVIDLGFELYDEVLWNDDLDVFRVKDVMNAFTTDQFESKKWLVRELAKVYDPMTKHESGIMIMGGWYGLLGMLVKDKWKKKNVVSVDLDEGAPHFVSRLGFDLHIETDDAITYFFERSTYYDLIINTSTEHMEQEDIEGIMKVKPEYVTACFQSNDMYHVPSHVNCHASLEEFKASLGLNQILFEGEKKMADGHKRFMVIGK